MSAEPVVPLLDLKRQYAVLRPELQAAAQRVLDSGIFVMGPEGAAFETEFAAASGAKRAVGCSSGAQALTVALEALGVGPGDAVAVPAFTFLATAVAPIELGAAPILVDVSPDGLTMDAADLERRLTPAVKAVIPVHLYGRPADMDPILAVAKKRGLKVVEDCAQSHLGLYKGRPIGTLGDFGAFSFYPSKNLGALGDAGALTTASDELAVLAASLRNCGRGPGGHYDHPRVGHNYRLDELQAAFLRVKLARLLEWTQGRRRVADLYRAGMAGLPVGLPTADRPGDRQVYHVFSLRSDRRDALKAHLESKGVKTGVYYPDPLHTLGALRHLGHRPGDFPEAEKAAREALALPIFPEMTDAEAGRVVAAVRSFFA
ncbi:MAG: DegT/DnrJ/EryC1/StrS family aminotransferase [Elusimicrobia bacterium]|nr:DegT/DnrJ/EryC1/StrS family aminotransferase [Elusimicrobiota bacterium]